MKKVYSIAISCFMSLSIINIVAAKEENFAKKSTKKFLIDKLTPKITIDRNDVINSATNVSTKTYPNADYVLLDDYEYIYYNEDGTSFRSDEVYTKILTEEGRRENNTLAIGYSASYSNIEVNAVEIIKPDGSVIKIDIAKNSKTSISSSQLGQNIFDPNSKNLTINIPNLEVGDILYYVCSRKTFKPRVPGTWCGYFMLQSLSPYLKYSIEISAPQSLPLKKIYIKDEVKNSTNYTNKVVDKRIIYNWKIKNVPQIIPENGMPKVHTVAQRLLVSTISSWQDISKWYWKLCEKPLADVTPEMKNKVQELTEDCKDSKGKITALFQFVAKEVRYTGLTIEKEAPGYEPHNVSITFNNRYGVCRDKAALLVAMLKIAGFEAYPVLFYSGPKKDIEVPNNYFNHAIVGIREPDGSFLLMDPTDETTRDLLPSYLSNMSFLPATNYGETLQISPIVDANKNLVKIKTQANLDLSGTLIAKSILKFQGVNDGLYRGAFSRWKKDEMKNFFEGHLSAIFPQVSLENITVEPKNIRDMSKPLQVTLSYKVNDFINERNKLAMIKAPWLSQQFGVVNFALKNTGLQKRKYPLKLYSSCGIKEEFSIDITNIGKTLLIPQAKNINSSFLEWNQNIVRKNGKLTGSTEFLIKTMEISPTEYLGLKKVIKEIDFEKRKKLVFNKEGLTFSEIAQKYKNENSVLLDSKTDYIVTENGYTASLKVKRLILNYAGKKEFGELKIQFNPIFEKVTLKSGKVTTKDGRVKTISKTELNYMDTAVGGSTPRYPQNKIMVATFPSVEVGSIIEYEVQKTITNSAIFSIMKPLQSYDVSLNKNLTILNKVKKSKSLNCSQLQTLLGGKNISTNKEIVLNIPEQKAIKAENNQPPTWAMTPTLFVTNSTWNEYITLLKKQLIRATKENKIIKNKVNEILKDLNTKNIRVNSRELYIVHKIRDFIAKNIRLAGANFTNLPLTYISNAAQTLQDGYGNNIDIAVLYYSMLKAAESTTFEPKFILMSSLPNVEKIINPIKKYTQKNMFNSILVKVNIKGKTYYLGESQGQNLYAYLATTNYENCVGIEFGLTNDNKNNIKFSTITPQENLKNKNEYIYDIYVAKDGTTNYQYKHKIWGSNYNNFKRFYLEMNNKERQQYFQKTVASISQSAKPLQPLKIDVAKYPALIDVNVSINDYAIKDKQFLYFSLPNGRLKNIFKINSKKRTTPFYFSKKIKFTTTYNVTIPDDTKIELLPESFSWTGPNNLGTINSKVTKSENNKIIITFDVDLKPALLSLNDFKQVIAIQEKLKDLSSYFILGKIK